MATFRESETETIALIEWHRSCGRTVTRRTEQAMTEADACAAAHALIGQRALQGAQPEGGLRCLT